MNKRTKLILSILGVAAIVLPIVLLIVFTSRTSEAPEVSQEKRTVDQEALSKSVKKNAPKITPQPVATASASPLATPAEGTQGAR